MKALLALSLLSLASCSAALPQVAPADAQEQPTRSESEPVDLIEPYALLGFNVTALNATTAEINFVLPLFSLGKPARAVLTYGGLPVKELEPSQLLKKDDEPPKNIRWIERPSIRTPEGTFSTPFVKYYLRNLKPEHKYWLDLAINFDNQTQAPFNESMLSEMQTIVMPAAPQQVLRPNTQLVPPAPTQTPATSTSTSTTSATTSTTSTTSAPAIEEPIQTGPPAETATFAEVPATEAAPSSPPPPLASTTSTSPPPSVSEPAGTNLKPTELEGSGKTCTDYVNNQIEGPAFPLPWVEITLPINGPIQRHAWHLLIALSIMTTLFAIVSYMYLKKSGRVIAPISNKKPIDPTIAKLVSYYAILVDENNQNYANDALVAKQKTLELEQSSPPPFIMNSNHR